MGFSFGAGSEVEASPAAAAADAMTSKRGSVGFFVFVFLYGGRER